MKPELKKALYLLENIGYTVKPMNESEQNDLVEEIKAKCDEWEELKDTPEGDDLWDEMVDTYGQDLVGLVADEYDAIKKGEPVDMTVYLAHAEDVYPEFFELMKKVGAKAFKVNTKKAFGGDAYCFYQAIVEGNIQLQPEAYDSRTPEYAFFTVKN